MDNILLKLKSVDLQLNEKRILNNISLDINAGDFIILLGSNGSGKSTLLNLIYRQHLATHGEIYFEGKSLQSYDLKQFYKQVKFLNQNSTDTLFNQLSIFENYRLIKNPKIKHERQFLQEYLGVFNPNLAHKLDQVVSGLSGGEKQALALAFTTLNMPKLLLLDEHTSALDPKTVNNIMELTAKLLKKHKITCVLTTHDLNIAQKYGDRIIVLKNGHMHKEIDIHAKQNVDIRHMLDEYY